MLFKIVVAISCLSMALAVPEQASESAIQKCLEEVPTITEADLKEFKANPRFTTTKPDLKCFTKCVGIDLNCIDKEGHLLKSSFFDTELPSYLDEAKVKENFAKCSAIVGTDVCDTAYQQWNCIATAAEKKKL